MAIAYDTTSNSGDTASANAASWSHTCTGSNRILVVGIGARDSDLTDRQADSVTYNGVGLTLIRSDDSGSTNTELWYLINPATGTNTITVTMKPSGLVSAWGGVGISLTGVDQTNPIDAQNGTTGSSASSSIAVSTITNNAWIIDVAFTTEIGTSDITVGGHATHAERAEINLSSDNVNGGTAGPISPAGSTTVSWSWTGTETWNISAVSLKDASEGGVSTIVKDMIMSGLIPFAR